MSYKLVLSYGYSGVTLYDFGGVYKCVILFTNGQFIVIDVASLHVSLLEIAPKGTPIYYYDESNLKGRILCVNNGSKSPNMFVWDFNRHEKSEVSSSNVFTNCAYDREYNFGSGQMSAIYYERWVFHDHYSTRDGSEEGDLLFCQHGYANSPSIGQYSIADKQWKYTVDHADEELERIRTRKFGIKFTFAFTPVSIFDGKYILPTTTAADGKSMLHNDLLAIILANPLLPEIVGGSDEKIRNNRLFIHNSDAKINQGTPSTYLRVFYRCYYEGEDRWCLADLNNITNDYILITDVDCPYESWLMSGHMAQLSAFTSLSSVAHVCTATYTSQDVNDEAWWVNGLFYGFGGRQIHKYLGIGSYEGTSRPFFAYLIDRETGDFLHPDLLDRHRFYNPTRGIITREEYYFENSDSIVRYLCNFHGQYGYNSNDVWVPFLRNYEGKWFFPREDHTIQPYGSKFVEADFTPYDPDTNPLGYIIRVANTEDIGGTIVGIDTTLEENYFTYNNIDYLNVVNRLYISPRIQNIEDQIITLNISMFNDNINICPRTRVLSEVRAVYGTVMSIYEIGNIIIANGCKYDPSIIYNLNDMSQYTILGNAISTEVTLLINKRWIVLSGYPGYIKVIDLINGTNTNVANIRITHAQVKDIAHLSQHGNILYWTAQHRRELAYKSGVVFGAIDWATYLATGTWTSIQVDCAYDINCNHAIDLRYNQLGLVEGTYTNEEVETAVLNWIAAYKEPEESDDDARDRLIGLLKASNQFKQYGLGNDGNYLFIGLYWQGNYAMSGCSFADSLSVLHTSDEDSASKYPTVKLVDISSVTTVSDLNDKSIYYNVEIRDATWLGRQHFGRLVLCGDYVMFFPEQSQSSDITAEFDGTNWCIPVYIVPKAILIAGIISGFVNYSEFTKLLIPCSTTEEGAKWGWGEPSTYEYRMMDHYAISEDGILYGMINNSLSFVNGNGQTVVPKVIKIDPSTATYSFVCGTGVYTNLATMVSYNNDKDVLWISSDNISYRLENASQAELVLLT